MLIRMDAGRNGCRYIDGSRGRLQCIRNSSSGEKVKGDSVFVFEADPNEEWYDVPFTHYEGYRATDEEGNEYVTTGDYENGLLRVLMSDNDGTEKEKTRTITVSYHCTKWQAVGYMMSVVGIIWGFFVGVSIKKQNRNHEKYKRKMKCRLVRQHSKLLWKMMVCLAGSICIGMLLLILTNFLPSERIKAHVKNGAYVMLQENAEFQYAEGYVESILDNSTDALILSKVVYPSEEPIKDAILIPSYSFPGQDADGMQLFGTLNDNPKENAEIDTYPRYWHGYLAVLKPFFTIFTFADFRILNQAMELILIFSVLLMMQKQKMGQYLPAFILMLIFWNPGTMGVSLQYAPCCYITLIFSLVLLWNKQSIQRENDQNILLLFLFSGIVTAYLDFLTYPVATLGIPLVFWILIRMEVSGGKEKRKRGREVVSLLQNIISWIFGYAGMWIGKWWIGSVLLHENLFADALNAVEIRTSTQDGVNDISRIGVSGYLLRYSFWKKPYLLLFVLFMVGIIAYCFARRKNQRNLNCIRANDKEVMKKRRLRA